MGEKIYVLSWVNQKGFIFSAKHLTLEGSFHYTGEGWGLTNDSKNLVMSDGTDEIRFLEPAQFKVVRRIFIKKGTTPVQRLNELEWYKGYILANIWQTDEIVQFSPETGCVVATYDGGKLPRPMPLFLRADVLNGIAYDSKADLLYLTGKLWPRIYEVRFK